MRHSKGAAIGWVRSYRASDLAQRAGNCRKVPAVATPAVTDKGEAICRFGELNTGQGRAGPQGGEALLVAERIGDFGQLRFKLGDSFDGQCNNLHAVHEKP